MPDGPFSLYWSPMKTSPSPVPAFIAAITCVFLLSVSAPARAVQPAVAAVPPATAVEKSPHSSAEAPGHTADQATAPAQGPEVNPEQAPAPQAAALPLQTGGNAAPTAPAAPEACPPLSPATEQAEQAEQAKQAAPAIEEPEEAPGLARARDNLRDFAFTRLVSMSGKLCYTARNHLIEQKEGGWVASYKDLAPDTLMVQVKPADTTGKNFIGLIKYAVLHYEARAEAKHLLAQQDFQMVKRLWQTEILRYDGKNWK